MLNRIKLNGCSHRIVTVCLSAALAMLMTSISAVEAGPMAQTPLITAWDSGSPLIKIAQCTQAQRETCDRYVKQCNRNALFRVMEAINRKSWDPSIRPGSENFDPTERRRKGIRSTNDYVVEEIGDKITRGEVNPKTWCYDQEKDIDGFDGRKCWQAVQGCAIHYSSCFKTCRW